MFTKGRSGYYQPKMDAASFLEQSKSFKQLEKIKTIDLQEPKAKEQAFQLVSNLRSAPSFAIAIELINNFSPDLAKQNKTGFVNFFCSYISTDTSFYYCLAKVRQELVNYADKNHIDTGVSYRGQELV